QEFMVVPIEASRFSDALRMGVEVFHSLKARLKKQGLATSVGDEGGFAPDLESNEAALRLLAESIEAAGYAPGRQIAIAIDAAASELYEDSSYVLAHEGRQLPAPELVAYCEGLDGRYA